MGRVSREARLCFVLMWTLADDEGRLRGDSRMLASLLFPYDDDAKDHIEGWLSALESEDCIKRYQVHRDSYIEICNWLMHQKIDKPSKSKIPQFANPREPSPKPRERSSEDLRIKDQGREWIKEGTVTRARAHPVWEGIRESYPAGIYREVSWLNAERKFWQLVDQGIDPVDLSQAVADYLRQQQAKNGIGTQFVLSPEKFFDGDRWRGPFPLPKTKAEVAQDANISASLAWLRESEVADATAGS